VLQKAVNVAANEVGSDKALGHPVLWRLTTERAVQALSDFVRSEAAVPFAGATPKYAELKFGTAEALEGVREVVVQPALQGERAVHLKGALDRVDQGPGVAGVADYKTKADKPGEKVTNALVSEFQLPVYLKVLQQLAPDARLEAAWLGMQDQSQLSSEKALGDPRDLLAEDAPTRRRLADEGKPNLANAVHGLLGRLRQGDFSPRAQSCEYCSFSSVCRISTRKLVGEGGPG
jgi:ATP-dependent helicase/DNAse subunit B